MKKIINISSRLFPNTMAYFAYKTLTNPELKKSNIHEIDILDKAYKEKILFRKFNIQFYQWGEPNNDPILLIHGWEGHSGNFADIIESLVEQNYYVLAFDGPSHGFSTKKQTNLLEFSDLIIFILQQYRIKKIISHSFGSMITTYALSRIPHFEIDKYILMTTPDTFLERINSISSQVGINEKTKQILIRKLEAELHTEVTKICVSKFVKEIHVKEALILHDKEDKIIPIRQARIVNENWINGNLEELENTGHFRILKEPFVIERIINFLKSN